MVVKLNDRCSSDSRNSPNAVINPFDGQRGKKFWGNLCIDDLLRGLYAFGFLIHLVAIDIDLNSSLQLLSRLRIVPSQCLQGFEKCA